MENYRDLTDKEWREKYGTDSYAKDAKIKEVYKEMNDQDQGARLRMDVAEKMPFAGPMKESINQTIAGGLSGPLETLEQERNRLTRQLVKTLDENETRMRVLRDMLEGLERCQKNGYYLRDSINQSSQIQMDQIHQMREYLK